MTKLHAPKIQYLVFMLSVLFAISCSKDSNETENSKKIKDIACKYSLNYSNSDSTIFDSLYIEYYHPQKGKNIFDTIISDDEWESPSLIFNSDDKFFLNAIVKSSSNNFTFSTRVSQKITPIDEQDISSSNNNFKSDDNTEINIIDRKTIIIDTKSISGNIQFSKK
ncbi:MAG TPA: hypothetical protein VLZ75_05090 [Chitinophagales bacterium]|nr:hypothetical protein [Chitinophagales bacterium]